MDVNNDTMIDAGLLDVTLFVYRLDDTPKLYNFDSRQFNPMTIEQWMGLLVPAMTEEYPCEGAMWYPSFKMTNSWLDYTLSSGLNEALPAYIVDLFTRVVGGKPKAARIHQKTSVGLLSLRYFMTVISIEINL